jgi:hypothetical protein
MICLGESARAISDWGKMRDFFRWNYPDQVQPYNLRTSFFSQELRTLKLEGAWSLWVFKVG